MASSVPSVILSNGAKCPALGLGTWLTAPGECAKAIKHAVDVGYRHFDCAWIYGNEKEIGDALREKIEDGSVKREELFVVTKLWNTFHERDQVVNACQTSLNNFGLGYIDLYLVHWPIAQKNIGKFDRKVPFEGAINYDYDYVDTWKGMEECVEKGLVKSIGLSNFNKRQITRILEAAKIKPVMNQVEVTPNINQKKLIDFCKEKNIKITAYSPFGSPARPWAKPDDPVLSLSDPKLAKIGEKYGKTPAQIILRYLIQLDTIPIPKSANPERMKQNLEVFDFQLAPEDVAVLDSFNCNGRAIMADELKSAKEYPFNDEY